MNIFRKLFLMGKLDALSPVKLKPEIDPKLLVLPKDETIDRPVEKKSRGCSCGRRNRKP
jgi:hypothetical protein